MLTAADVGIAIAGREATVASESTAAVITSNDIARVANIAYISRRNVQIALQAICTGTIISMGLMLVATFFEKVFSRLKSGL